MRKLKPKNEKIYNELVSKIVDTVETEFHIGWKSDDAGWHWVVSVPEDHGVEDLRKKIPARINKKRVILSLCPPGYIEAFLNEE